MNFIKSLLVLVLFLFSCEYDPLLYGTTPPPETPECVNICPAGTGGLFTTPCPPSASYSGTSDPMLRYNCSCAWSYQPVSNCLIHSLGNTDALCIDVCP